MNPTPTPWQARKPVHISSEGHWRVTIASGPIPVARALGVTRRHAVANAAAIVAAVNAVEAMKSEAPASHEAIRQSADLLDRLGEDARH